jgi:hypothetical protein
MDTSPTRLLLAVLAVSFALSPAARAQGIDLRPRFEMGQQTRFKMELAGNRQIKMGGENGDQKDTMNQEIRFLLRVVDAKPEAASTVELVYEGIKVRVNSPMANAEFDSDSARDKDAGNMLAPSLRPLVGTVLTLTIDPEGNITSVTGGEGILNSGMAEQFGQASGVKQLFGPIFTTRKSPGGVKVGQTWENEDKLDMGMIGAFKMTTKHTLRSAVADEASLTFTGKIEAASDAPADAPLKIKDSTFEGQYAWDLRQGMLKSMQSSQKVKLEGSVGGQAVSMTSDATMKITRIQK